MAQLQAAPPAGQRLAPQRAEFAGQQRLGGGDHALAGAAVAGRVDGVGVIGDGLRRFGHVLRAEALGIRIALNVSDKELTLNPLSGDFPLGQALHLSLFHPTLAGLDSEHLLTADGKGVYRLMLDKPLTGKWHVRVDAFNHEWRLQETVQLPTKAPVELDPKGR